MPHLVERGVLLDRVLGSYFSLVLEYFPILPVLIFGNLTAQHLLLLLLHRYDHALLLVLEVLAVLEVENLKIFVDQMNVVDVEIVLLLLDQVVLPYLGESQLTPQLRECLLVRLE